MQILQDAYNAQRDKVIFEKGSKMAENNKANSESKGFVDGLKAEFRKIVWPTQEVLAKQTAAVIAVSLVLGAIIAALDWAFRLGLTRVFQ